MNKHSNEPMRVIYVVPRSHGRVAQEIVVALVFAAITLVCGVGILRMPRNLGLGIPITGALLSISGAGSAVVLIVLACRTGSCRVTLDFNRKLVIFEDAVIHSGMRLPARVPRFECCFQDIIATQVIVPRGGRVALQVDTQSGRVFVEDNEKDFHALVDAFARVVHHEPMWSGEYLRMTVIVVGCTAAVVALFAALGWLP